MCVRILNNIQQMGLQSNLNVKTKRKISVDYKVMWSKVKVKVNKDNVTVWNHDLCGGLGECDLVP